MLLTPHTIGHTNRFDSNATGQLDDIEVQFEAELTSESSDVVASAKPSLVGRQPATMGARTGRRRRIGTALTVELTRDVFADSTSLHVTVGWDLTRCPRQRDIWAFALVVYRVAQKEATESVGSAQSPQHKDEDGCGGRDQPTTAGDHGNDSRGDDACVYTHMVSRAVPLAYTTHIYVGSARNTASMILPRVSGAGGSRFIFRIVNLLNTHNVSGETIAEVSLGCHPQRSSVLTHSTRAMRMLHAHAPRGARRSLRPTSVSETKSETKDEAFHENLSANRTGQHNDEETEHVNMGDVSVSSYTASSVDADDIDTCFDTAVSVHIQEEPGTTPTALIARADVEEVTFDEDDAHTAVQGGPTALVVLLDEDEDVVL